AIKNTNAPWEPIPAIFAETESYYVLGIAPSSQKDDGAFHKISVEAHVPGDTDSSECHPRRIRCTRHTGSDRCGHRARSRVGCAESANAGQRADRRIRPRWKTARKPRPDHAGRP